MTFNKQRMMNSPDWPKMAEMIWLLIESRDALPAITKLAARIHNLDLTLADRIEDCLEPWELPEEEDSSER